MLILEGHLQSHSAKPTLILTSGSLFSHFRSAILIMVTSLLLFMHQLVFVFVGEKAKCCIVNHDS